MTPDMLRGKRILIVEDNAIIALHIEDILQEAGAETVGPADTVEYANQLVQDDGLTGAILDIRLHEDEVWPIARQLRQRDVPFLFYSGNFSPGTLPAEWAGTPILSKPAQPWQIVEKLADVVARH